MSAEALGMSDISPNVFREQEVIQPPLNEGSLAPFLLEALPTPITDKEIILIAKTTHNQPGPEAAVVELLEASGFLDDPTIILIDSEAARSAQQQLDRAVRRRLHEQAEVYVAAHFNAQTQGMRRTQAEELRRQTTYLDHYPLVALGQRVTGICSERQALDIEMFLRLFVAKETAA